MHPMPLPRFLVLIAAVIVAAGVTIFCAVLAGVPLAALGFGALLAAGLMRLLARVE